MRLCFDFCSGLGGLSEAFQNDTAWEIVRVDVERKFRPTIQADVRFLPLRTDIQVDAVLASPPCERFSLNGPVFPQPNIRRAFEVLGAILEYIARAKPKHWLIENPKARMRWFLGNPKHTIRLSDYGYPTKKPTDIWTDIQFNLLTEHKVYPKTHGWDLQHKYFPKTTELSAKMPMGLSSEIKNSLDAEAQSDSP